MPDAIRTLAWCIFWGLLLHGCMTSGEVKVTVNDGKQVESPKE